MAKGTLFEQFSSAARRHANKIAVESAGESWTYEQLYTFAAAVAHRLQQAVTPHEPVGLALPDDVRYPGAMLACLAAGCPCVPFDPLQPRPHASRVVLDEAWLKHLRPAGELNVRAAPDDVAYILYTSGSSGQERKAVYQNQRNLLHDVSEYIAAAGISADDHLTHLYAPHAIGAWRDIFGALLTGATLHTLDLRANGFDRLRSLLLSRKVTLLHAMPPVLRAFFRPLAPAEKFPSLRLVYAAGDRLFRQDLELIWPHLPDDARFYTGLGSTECSTLFRQWTIGRDTRIDEDLVPAGYPIDGRRTSIIGDDGQPVNPGEVGELLVTSPYLALGYWGNPELTAQRFRIDASGVPAYATGDLGREDEYGQLHFAGRRDDQVKVRGFRVSLGALEARVRRCSSVADTAVVAYRRGHDQQLAAFVVPAEGAATPDIQLEIEQADATLLSQLRVVPAIPLLPNGKRDLAQLRADVESTSASVLAGAAEQEDTDRIIEQSWLALPGGACADDLTWWQAGGDSLGALELFTRLERALSRRLPAQWISAGMTPLSLRQLLNRNLEAHEPQAASLFILPGLFGADLALLALARQLERSAMVQVLSFPGEDDLRQNRFDRLLQRHAAFISAERGGRPTHLLGYSFGARVAFHLAALLEKRGEPVSSVTLLDSSPDGRPNARRKAFARVTGLFTRAAANPGKAIETALRQISVAMIMRGLAPPRVFRNRVLITTQTRVLTAANTPTPYYAGAVHLFTSQDPLWSDWPPDLGWSRFAEAVRVTATAAPNHKTILEWPGLAEALQGIMF